MSPSDLRLVDAARSDRGKVRELNEDSFLADRARGLWVVADGMGGHDNGEWASRMVVESLGATDLGDDFEADVGRLADQLHAANRTIFEQALGEGRTTGSTAIALLIREDQFAVLWAGDSRAYLMRDGALWQLTQDHTHVQDLVKRGALSESEAVGHPMAHVLSRAIGVDAVLNLEGIKDEALAGDVFLLCSDGLHGVVPEDELRATLAVGAPARAVDRLIGAALDRGGPDNVTIIAVACEQVTVRPGGGAARP